MQIATHWKSPWCWERLRVEAEEDIRGWDGWMASLMQWTWTWANSRRWWRTGKPGMLQDMGSQGVRHDWVTEQASLILTTTHEEHNTVIPFHRWRQWDTGCGSVAKSCPPLCNPMDCSTPHPCHWDIWGLNNPPRVKQLISGRKTVLLEVRHLDSRTIYPTNTLTYQN